MKNILITIALIIISLATYGQSLSLSSYVEQTQIGPKLGTSIGFNTNIDIEVGGFYQKAVEVTGTEGMRPWKIEQEFYGAYFNYPITKGEHLGLKFNVRTGVSNGENFVITPSLLGSLSPVKAIKIGAGLGVRALRPTLMGSISIQLSSFGKSSGYLASK